MAFATTAKLVVHPLLDLLLLDNESLFNTPGTSEGNWTWRQKNINNELEGALGGLWRTRIDLEALKTMNNGNHATSKISNKAQLNDTTLQRQSNLQWRKTTKID